MKTVYLAAKGFEEPLLRELGGVDASYGRLFVKEGPPLQSYWAQAIWFDVQTIRFRSISEAAKQLRALHGLWAYFPFAEVRKGALIQELLPYFFPKPLVFGTPLPSAPLGSWTLLDKETLLAAPRCSSPMVHGEFHFCESKTPPSRAYLKLWELFTRMNFKPQAGDRCLELGACPGSWTWVLHSLGANVTAIDRSPLEIELPGVRFFQKDAFSIKPDPSIDWVFSDLACTPQKLLDWILPWLEIAPKTRFVCTLKFQGKDNYEAIRPFEKIADSQLLHLYHNKHELTWVLAHQKSDLAQ